MSIKKHLDGLRSTAGGIPVSSRKVYEAVLSTGALKRQAEVCAAKGAVLAETWWGAKMKLLPIGINGAKKPEEAFFNSWILEVDARRLETCAFLSSMPGVRELRKVTLVRRQSEGNCLKLALGPKVSGKAQENAED